MFIILTSKVGEFDAKPESGLTIVKSFEYLFYQKRKAMFNIAKVDSSNARVSVIELDEKGSKNSIPIKFFENYETVEAAEKELAHLIHSKVMDVDLRQVAVA
jgi:hypothetical protein